MIAVDKMGTKVRKPVDLAAGPKTVNQLTSVLFYRLQNVV